MSAKDIQNYGRNIRSLRMQLEMTQLDLASAVCVCDNHIGQIERGYRCGNLDMAIRLSKFFGCSLDELVSNERLSNG